MYTTLTRVRRNLAPVLLALLATSVSAQGAYPNKMIRLVVPFAAGGAVDTVGRSVGEKLGTQMGQPVIIDNKPGANANIGTENVVRSPADGYTLLVAANGVVTNNTLYPKLGFNGLKDFAPISKLGYAPLVLVTAASEPYNTVQELIAAAHAKPGSMTYGSAGNGSSGHLAGALLESVGKFDAVHVAYKGGSPALIDLIAGRLSFMLLNPLEVLPHLQSGKLKALAVSGDQRAPMLPKVPTMAEAGLPNFEATVWWTLLAPAGTPADVVARLNTETRKALADPAVRDRLNGLGAVITPSSPAQAADFLKSESAKWERVIRAANIQPD
ncbi:tripartite tricarboxylate transporter substrate binding protein [Xylophilus rhododendri]|uniref:Tripartite tricarboxylate transporter substrate binding protein n=1 Tax=Xylophilus rhododendri TaxID=2697032 RepID=A0A857J3W6_9BURK|nr:tripartite tricarboxylate transporter substrate binding protein [Xylophilus rhododendri]QHI98466.1 tripartite tricarboxylate transporter substrate binding protein [Xylophilus rhododendri]